MINYKEFMEMAYRLIFPTIPQKHINNDIRDLVLC
jgi:hypothetical protein